MDKEGSIEKKRKFPIVFCLIIALLLLGSFIGLFSGSSDTAELEDTAQGYFEAIQAKEYTKAYYDYTSEGFQKETPLALFKNGIKGYTLFQTAGSLQFNKREVEDEKGLLQGIIKSVDGLQAPIVLHFVKQEGEWKIADMEADLSVKAVKKQQ